MELEALSSDRRGLQFGEIARSLAEMRLPSLVTRASLPAVGLAVLGIVWLAGPRLWTHWVPPAAGEAREGAEEAAFAAAARTFRGRIVWASNRSGDHELYLLDTSSGSPRRSRLTRDLHVDTFPRFSPDGERILFNRSRKSWVSFRDPEPWDVWIMNRDGTGARRIAERGFHASFSKDGRFAVFARGGNVVRAAVDGSGEEVLLDSQSELGGWVQEPDLRARRLAGTVRGGKRAFGVYDLAERRFHPFKGDSCQIAWWPNKKRLLWVESGSGRGGNRVMVGPADGSRNRAILDLPGSFSHEYFPRVSRDGAWLVLGASAGGHEHDRADYEIFLWRVGTPAAQALRLTHHSGNDQWPDVWPDDD